ncbi:MAG: ketopantoate reductase family protein, partial [Deltaproteobacteria bacterium]|nr:ketopantoate reductase family protein [Deltaproteobacteria bacterium]
MRFLVYGAGNIGSLYAARLAQSSQEVAILARGTRLEQIRQQGIEL